MNVHRFGIALRLQLKDPLHRLMLDLAVINAFRAGRRAERKRRKASAARRYHERTRRPNRLERAILRTLAGNPNWAPSIFYITKTQRRAAAFQWLQDRDYIRRLHGHYADQYPYCVFAVMPWATGELALPERRSEGKEHRVFRFPCKFCTERRTAGDYGQKHPINGADTN